ncbi:hypothetical protein [Streptacidiphilus sp. EB129]|uniref:hypothetical protein n=1 Tax=Streptacidiphilus sp. EB129 TaxID=3156262 RepID=UPI00351145D6
MKQLARRLGKTLAFVLPVVLVTTGTLAVTRVPWAPADSGEPQVLAAAARSGPVAAVPQDAPQATPQDVLRSRLLQQLQAQDPGAALDSLAQAMQQQPSLTRYCTDIARDLGQAAVRKYQGDVRRAQSFSRPVCDGSFAAGAMAAAG